MESCLARREYAHIAIDATIRIMRRVRGQADYRATPDARADAAIQDGQAFRRVLTIMGRTSAPLGSYVIAEESADVVRETLMTQWTSAQRGQVLTVVSDNPSGKMLTELRRALPNLLVLALDPVHLAMTYEHTHFRKRTPGSRVLRILLMKFARSDPSLNMGSWGVVYEGNEAAVHDTNGERHFRDMILHQSMQPSVAARVLNALDAARPWRRPLEVLQAFAAHAAHFSGELNRRTHQRGVSLGRLIWNACQPGRLQWLFNNLRLLHSLPPSQRSMMATGTTSCEAQHAEWNRLFRNQPEVFTPTVRLQLKVATLAKLLIHVSAMTRPTLRQMRPDAVLAYIVGSLQHKDDVWRKFCTVSSHDASRLRAEPLPLAQERANISRIIRDHQTTGGLKRPAGALHLLRERHRGVPVKRTAFTQKRAGRLVPPALRIAACPSSKRRVRLVRKTQV